MRGVGVGKVAAASFPCEGEHWTDCIAPVRHPTVPEHRRADDHVPGFDAHADRRLSGKSVLPILVLAQVSAGRDLHGAILEVRIYRRDVHDKEGSCEIAIGVWVLCATVRQVKIASDIGHCSCGRRKLSDEFEDAVLLKFVVYKPRLNTGKTIEMAADRAAAREQPATCADAVEFAAQLFGQCRKSRF